MKRNNVLSLNLHLNTKRIITIVFITLTLFMISSCFSLFVNEADRDTDFATKSTIPFSHEEFRYEEDAVIYFYRPWKSPDSPPKLVTLKDYSTGESRQVGKLYRGAYFPVHVKPGKYAHIIEGGYTESFEIENHQYVYAIFWATSATVSESNALPDIKECFLDDGM